MSKNNTQQLVKQDIEAMKTVCRDEGVNRTSLDKILAIVIGLAGRRELWGNDQYPDPPEDELQVRYLIHEETDQTFALYLNVMRPGKKVIPHNHTTWACIASVSGVEYNYVYNRLDKADVPGHAVIEEAGEVIVRPGTGIALMPDDIHAVRIHDNDVIRHLHMYGRALETLSERIAFDVDANTCRIMDIGVQSKR